MFTICRQHLVLNSVWTCSKLAIVAHFQPPRPTTMTRIVTSTPSPPRRQLQAQVKLGDKLPADIRLTENQELKVDNSTLTGESEPIGRTVDCTDENSLKAKNLAKSIDKVVNIIKGVWLRDNSYW